MPFEIAPRKVRPFDQIADAIRRGCAKTKPCYGSEAFRMAPDGTVTHACLWGAYCEGGGGVATEDLHAASDAYLRRYGSTPLMDHFDGKFTREQIAARIAAL